MSQQQDRVQKIILRNLLHNETYTRKVMPFLKEEYFIESQAEKWIFYAINEYLGKYNESPTTEAVMIALKPNTHISEPLYQDIAVYLKELGQTDENSNEEWLINETEKFCRDTALYNATLQAITIMEGKDKKQTSKQQIPDLLKDALAISFDPHIGHDYIVNAPERFDFYHKKETKVPFNLTYFDRITKGGLPTKTLNIILAGTGVGKSLFMCHMAGSCLMHGKNVLYVTLEMAEQRIAERIDANLLNLTLDDLLVLSKDMYQERIDNLNKKELGRLIIKEYPTASAHAGNFRALMDELQLKLKFKPDLLIVDYLNICASRRFNFTSSMTSYTYIKAIAEELRGLAVEYDIPILSATQTTRQGSRNTDVELTDTSESFGLPATADFMFAISLVNKYENKEDDPIKRNKKKKAASFTGGSARADELGTQFLVKQLKNRYNDFTINQKFYISVDRTKMRLMDASEEAQKDESLLQEINYVSPDDETPNVLSTTSNFKEWKY